MKKDKIEKISLFSNFLFTFVTVLLFLFISEVLFRVVSFAGGQIESRNSVAVLDALPMVMSAEDRIFELKPNYQQLYKSPEFEINIRTNTDGLRDTEHSLIKPPNVYRIIALGDSMTFGWGVNEGDTWWRILEKKLNDNSKNKKYEIINLGVWMYTYDQQYLRLKEKGLKYQPDLVIQEIYWPHLRTIATHQWERDRYGRIIKINDPTIYITKEGILKIKDKNPLIYFLKQHFQLANFIISRLQSIILKKSLITSDLYLLDSNSFKKFNDSWKKAFESLKLTKQLLERKGIPYVIFLIPRDVQVSKKEWSPLYNQSMNEEMFTGDVPQKIFKDFAESERIKLIDLLPIFRKHYHPDLYFPIDPHLTEKGHRLISEILFKFLKSGNIKNF